MPNIEDRNGEGELRNLSRQLVGTLKNLMLIFPTMFEHLRVLGYQMQPKLHQTPLGTDEYD